MKRSIVIAILLMQGFQAYTQTILTGIVTDADDNKPVEYASIGVTTIPNGTVSDTIGAFRIALNDKVGNDDTLKFWSIGYQSEAFLIRDIKERSKSGPLNIVLRKAVTRLKEVSIVGKKAHTKIVGYDRNSKLFGLGFDAGGVGSQAGIIIPVKHAETSIQNLSFLIIQNTFTHLLFRVNVYNLVNNKPGDNILSENILINVDDKRTGKMTFDLSKYHIYLDKDVLLTLEWIEARPADGKLAVAATPFGRTYFRQASQYTWNKKGTGLGVSVKTAY